MAYPSPYLTKAVTKVDIASGEGPHYAFAVANCQGWRVTQEDAHMAVANFEVNTSLYGVFDGHNGLEVAKYVARNLPMVLRNNESYSRGMIERGIEEAFILIDTKLMDNAVNDELLKYREEIAKAKWSKSWTEGEKPKVAMYTGCTGVVLLIKNDIYYCANVGDSRCVLSRNGKAFPLSKDHKPDQAEEKTRIEKAGGEVINGRINKCIDVSRAFGDHHFKANSELHDKEQMIIAWPHSKVERVLYKEDQFVVLMCDGIWNAMDNPIVVDFVAKHLAKSWTLSKICEEIIKQILPSIMPEKGIVGKDNMTVMIVKAVTTTKNETLKSKEKVKPKSNDASPKCKKSPSNVKSTGSKTKKHSASSTHK